MSHDGQLWEEGFDDEMWEELWERTFDQVERHRLARSTLLRELPDDALGRRVVPELARRWRRSAAAHAVFNLLWVLFWGSIAQASTPAEGMAWPLANAMMLFSLTILFGCVAFRRYLHPVTRYSWRAS